MPITHRLQALPVSNAHATKFYLNLRNISDREIAIVTELGEPGRAACRVFSCAHLSKGRAYKVTLDYACRRYTGNSHAILEIKMTAGYFGITCTPPVSLCFSSDPSLFVRLLFSSQVRILWALLARPCPFFLLFTGKQIRAAKWAAWALRLSHG